MDIRLAQLGRGVGAMRFRIGEGLSKLEALGGIQALGFPTLESYAREALGRSGRWGADARALARRLERLPALRVALVSGALTTSMVELVARVATPDDDAEWAERARNMTVRGLRVLLKAERLVEVEDDTTVPRSTLTLQVDRVEAWAFERARAMVEAVGATRGDGVIEAMLAEGLGELMARDGDIDLPSGIGGTDDTRAERAELARLREQREAAAESVPPEELDAVAVAIDEAIFGEDVASVDGALRAQAHELARRDVELAKLARLAAELELWRVFRFASFDHYCRERIGLSPSSVATRMALARRVESLPEVERALVTGRIGYEAATLVARVAGTTTVSAWVERAAERTVKHLREEVDAVELVCRIEDRDARRVGPPDEDTLAEVLEVERAALGLVAGQTSGQMSDQTFRQSGQGPGQMSGTSQQAGDSEVTSIELPMTTLRLSLSDDLARFWSGLERVHAGMDPTESFVAFLVRSVTKSWAGTVAGGGAYSDIYLRDRWRCASPICRSRNVQPHHIVFRSHGGGEQPGNLVSICTKCHLELVHLGKLRVSGDAEVRLRWQATGWGVAGRLLESATG